MKESAGEDFAIDCSSSDDEVSLNPSVPLIMPLYLSPVTKLPPKTECEIDKTENYVSFKQHQYNKVLSPPESSDSDQESPAVSGRGQRKLQEPGGKRIPLSTLCSHEKFNLTNTKDFLPVCTLSDTNKSKNKINIKESGVMFPSSEASQYDEATPHNSRAYGNAFEPHSPVLGRRRNAASLCSPLIKTKKTKDRTCSFVSGSHKVSKRKLAISNIAPVNRQIFVRDETAQINVNYNARADISKEKHKKLYDSSDLNCYTKTGNLKDKFASVPDKYEKESTIGQDASQDQNLSCYCIPRPEVFRQEQSLSDWSDDHHIKKIVPKYEDQISSTNSDSDLQPVALTGRSSTQGISQLCVDHQPSQNIAATSEGVDTQADYNIEIPLSNNKHLLDGITLCEVSFP